MIESHDGNEPTGKAKGGKALAEKRTPEERKAASQKATAVRRELASLPEVFYGSPDTPLEIGGVKLECYVLDDADKTRVITAGGAGVGLGFHPSSA